MQLSSVFLSVTAFLAQAASGFYLLQATHDKLSDLGYAKVQFYGTQATVWFNNHVDAPFAPIHLDVGGDLGSGFVFRAQPLNYGPYENGWEMLSRAATSVEVRTFISQGLQYPPLIKLYTGRRHHWPICC
jgi:hypothetical protein